MTGPIKATMHMHSGINVDIFNLQPEDINVYDIAHHLAMQCRWIGATRFHYSVAQHSIYVAAQIYGQTRDFARARKGLLHDGSEAYLSDVARPIKELPALEMYLNIEAQIQRRIYQAFHLSPEDDEIIARVDNEVLIMEGQQLFRPPYYPPSLVDISPTWDMTLHQWTPELAEQAFITCFNDAEKLISVGAGQFKSAQRV